MVADIKDFYLNTPMERYEYMRLPLSIIPDKIVDQYSLKDLVTPDGWVYIEIRKRMYGIKQAGLIANVRLTAHLAKYGYAPTPRTPGLWRHHTCNISFCLVIDDFGVKYSKLSKTFTLSPPTGKENFIVASLSNGTTPKNLSTSLCPTMFLPLFTSSDTTHQPAVKMHPTSGLNPLTAPKYNMHLILTPVLRSTNPK